MKRASLLLWKIIWHTLSIFLSSLVVNSINLKCNAFYTELAIGSMIPLDKTGKWIASNMNKLLLHANLLLWNDHGCSIFSEKRPNNFTSPNPHISTIWSPYKQHDHRERPVRKKHRTLPYLLPDRPRRDGVWKGEPQTSLCKPHPKCELEEWIFIMLTFKRKYLKFKKWWDRNRMANILKAIT